MSEYFGAPVPPASNEWTTAPSSPVMPAWAGGEPPVPGPWPALRPVPWLGGLLGALSGLLVATGVFGLLSQAADEGDSGSLLAGALAAIVVAGLVVAVPRTPRGPWSVAAVTAAFVLAAVPMGFWLSAADDLSIKTMLLLFVLVPTAVWAACFATGGTRGRPVFLAGALLGLWLLVSVLAIDTGEGEPFGGAPAPGAQVSATLHASQAQPPDRDGDGIPDDFDPEPDTNQLVDSDGDGIPDEFDTVDDGTGSGSGDTVDLGDLQDDGDSGISESIDPTRILPLFFGIGAAGTAVGLVALLFGAGYLAAAWAFDSRGLPASATPFQAVGITAMLVALGALSGDLKDGGTSFLALALGAALIWLGCSAGRRLSAWLGVALAMTGAGQLVSSAIGNEGAAAALLLLLGVGVLVGTDRLLPDSGPDDLEIHAGPAEPAPLPPVSPPPWSASAPPAAPPAMPPTLPIPPYPGPTDPAPPWTPQPPPG